MPHVTLPVVPDGLIVEVLIGLTGKDTVALLAAGKPVLRPILLRGTIDTGSDVTCVASAILNQLGLTSILQLTSNTVGGLHHGRSEVSFGIPRTGRLTGPLLVIEHLEVMELVQAPQGIDVLVGRDVLRQMLTIYAGPRDEFTLSD